MNLKFPTDIHRNYRYLWIGIFSQSVIKMWKYPLLSNLYDSKSLSPIKLLNQKFTTDIYKTHRIYRYLWIDTFSQGVIKYVNVPMLLSNYSSLSLWTRDSTQTSIETPRNNRYLWIDIFFSECFLQLGQRWWRGCRWKNQQVEMFKKKLFLCHCQGRRIS